MDEAVEWVKRCPNPMPARREIEIRPVFEMEDFGAGVHARAARAGGARCAPSGERQRSAGASAPACQAADGRRRRDAHQRDRGGLADRVAPGSSPASPGSCATSASPRSSRRTRSSPRSSSGRESGVPDNPGAWLMATAKHRAIDSCAGDSCSSASTSELGRELEVAARDRVDDARGRDRRRHRRRPAAPGLHRLPPGALDRGARRADAAPARRPDDRRDRARVPRPGADRSRSASCAPSGPSPRRTCRSRCRAAPSCAARLASVLEVIYLDLQRGLRRDRRRRLDAPRALRGGAAPRPRPGRAGAGRAGGPRPASR